MMKIYSKSLFWLACFALLSISGLLWGCAALKEKYSKKESQMVSLSREEVLKDQSVAMEHKERELMKYFGESAVLMLSDGFRFHQDSGLIGERAILHYRLQAMATEKQKDSTSAAHISERSSVENARLKTEETEKRKAKLVFNWWWLLLLLPVLWFIGKRSR